MTIGYTCLGSSIPKWSVKPMTFQVKTARLAAYQVHQQRRTCILDMPGKYAVSDVYAECLC